MPVGDKQKLITEIVSIVLNEGAQSRKFPWFINQHQNDHFKDSFKIIHKIYIELKGETCSKMIKQLQCDAYFGGKYNFLFEFDEFQHFSTARLKAINNYPKDLKVNYSVDDWKKWCLVYSNEADKYRFNKTTKDFDFKGGRTCQRAYLDCFRDLLPQYNGLNPTLRISEFEVKDINQINSENVTKIKRLVENKLKFL
jgi:hypothetical protein